MKIEIWPKFFWFNQTFKIKTFTNYKIITSNEKDEKKKKI